MVNDVKYYINGVNSFYINNGSVSKVFLGNDQVWPGCVSEYWVSLLNTAYSEGDGVVTDSSGNSFVTGYALDDIFIAKYDLMGDILWQRTLNTEDVFSNESEVGKKVVLDGDGNLYIVGYCYIRNLEDGVFISGQSFQVFVIKCDSSGVVQWKRRLGVPWNCFGEDIVLDSSGNIYVTGSVKRVPPIADAILLAKYDNNGVLQWQRMLSESYGDSNIFPGQATTSLGYTGAGLALDTNGDLCLTGYRSIPNSSNSVLILAKYSTSGGFIWGKSLSYPGVRIISGSSIVTDGGDNIYVSGYAFSGDLSLDGLLVAKFNSSGVSQWQRVLTGGYSGSSSNDMCIGLDGRLYITGQTYDSGGLSSILVSSFSTSGFLIWQNRVKVGFESYGYGIASSDIDSICIAGQTTTSGGTLKLLSARLPNDGSLTGTYGSIIYEPTGLLSELVDLVVSPIELIDRAPFLNEAASSLSSSTSTLDNSAPSLTATSPSFTSIPVANWTSGLENYWITALINPNMGLLSGVTVDLSGNTYVSGVSYNPNGSPLLFKYDSSGLIQWQNTLSGMQGADFSGVVTDSLGNCYAYGTYQPTSIPGQFNTAALLVKYNSSGVVQWQRRLGDPSVISCSGIKVAVDTGDNLLCVGSAGNDGFLAKYDSSGVLQWQKSIVGTGETDIIGVSVDNSGNAYVSGTSDTGSSTGSYNVIIMKFSSSGTLQWQRRLGGLGFDVGYDVTVDGSGNSYVTGECAFYQSQASEILIAKYDTNGVIQWQRSLTKTTYSLGRGVTIDAGGNVYIVGYRSPGMVIIKYSSVGALQWQRTLTIPSGPGANAYQFGINVDGSGNVYVSGNLIVSYSPQSCYMLTAKLPPDGSILGTYGNVVYGALSLNEYPLEPEDATFTLAETVSTIASDKTGMCGTTVCDQPPYSCQTEGLNTYCVEDFTNAWQNCTSITVFPSLNVSSGIVFYQAWAGCSNMTTFLTTSFTQADYCAMSWYNCSSLTSFPLIDLSLANSCYYTWRGCSSLTSFPPINMGTNTSFWETWRDCSSLTSFGQVNTSSGRDFSGAWYNCSSLTSFPALDFSSADIGFGGGSSNRGAWENCTSLTTFPPNAFDNCPATSFLFTWRNCALTQQSVDNILVSIDTAGQLNGVLYINGGTSSAPGTSGSAAKVSLESKGWTVLVNSPPTINITTPISGDGIVDSGESENPLTISGTSSGVDGRTATINVGGVNYTTTVSSGGGWSITLTPVQIQSLAEGTVNVTADVSNSAGNAATQATASFTFSLFSSYFSNAAIQMFGWQEMFFIPWWVN